MQCCEANGEDVYKSDDHQHKGIGEEDMLGRRSMEALDVNKTLGKLKSKEVRVSKYRTNSYGVQLLNWHGRKIEQELTVHPLVGPSQILQCLFQ